jgi:hypothetical protein
MIIGFVGFISAGKDTAADYLVNYHEFRRDSFASTLKDAVAAVFGWDRTLLEGRTKEAREWREQVDTWWAKRLVLPDLTPRWVLQHWGTEVLRGAFHDEIWIASLENKMRKTRDNIVISDVRFPNEITAIRNAGGTVIRIRRGPDPEWYQHAENYNNGPRTIGWAIGRQRLAQLGIHASETAWIGQSIDFEIDNNGSISDLFAALESVIKSQELNRPAANALHLDEVFAGN